MKYKYFSDHIKRLAEHYMDGVLECEKILEKKNRLESEIERLENDSAMNPDVRAAKIAVLRAELSLDIPKELRVKNEEIRNAVKGMRADLEADIKEFTLVSPKSVDTNTMALISTGVTSPDDLVALANHHWNNPTMLKVITSEAEKHYSTSRVARVLGNTLNNFLSAENRLKMFDEAEYILTRTFRDSGYYPSMTVHTPALFEGVYNSMKELDTLKNLEV